MFLLPKRKPPLQKVTNRYHHHRGKDIAKRSIPGKGVHHEFNENPVDGRRNQGTQSVAEKLHAAFQLAFGKYDVPHHNKTK